MLTEKLEGLQDVVTMEDIASLARAKGVDDIIAGFKERFGQDLSPEEAQQIADLINSETSEEEIQQKMQSACPGKEEDVSGLTCNMCYGSRITKKIDHVDGPVYRCKDCNRSVGVMEPCNYRCRICGQKTVYRYVSSSLLLWHCSTCKEDRSSKEVE